MRLVEWQPLPTAITPSTTPSLSQSGQVPGFLMSEEEGKTGGGGAELQRGTQRSLAITAQAPCCRGSGRSLLLPADTRGGRRGEGQPRGCREAGASRIHTRAHANTRTHTHSQPDVLL